MSGVIGFHQRYEDSCLNDQTDPVKLRMSPCAFNGRDVQRVISDSALLSDHLRRDSRGTICFFSTSLLCQRIDVEKKQGPGARAVEWNCSPAPLLDMRIDLRIQI